MLIIFVNSHPEAQYPVQIEEYAATRTLQKTGKIITSMLKVNCCWHCVGANMADILLAKEGGPKVPIRYCSILSRMEFRYSFVSAVAAGVWLTVKQ